jgi:hypothetical protein
VTPTGITCSPRAADTAQPFTGRKAPAQPIAVDDEVPVVARAQDNWQSRWRPRPLSRGGGPLLGGFAPEDESRGSGRVDAGHALWPRLPVRLQGCGLAADRPCRSRVRGKGDGGSPSFRPGRAGGYVFWLRVAVYARWSSWHSSGSLVKVSPTSVALRPLVSRAPTRWRRGR